MSLINQPSGRPKEPAFKSLGEQVSFLDLQPSKQAHSRQGLARHSHAAAAHLLKGFGKACRTLSSCNAQHEVLVMVSVQSAVLAWSSYCLEAHVAGSFS